jgi:hypothetical protein
MAFSEPYQCRCPHCQPAAPSEPEGPEADPDRAIHRQMNLLMSRLDEQQRRWYVALESIRIGYGGDTLLSLITGLDEKTIQKGRQELAASLEGRPIDRIRLPGGGRPSLKKRPKDRRGSRSDPRTGDRGRSAE